MAAVLKIRLACFLYVEKLLCILKVGYSFFKCVIINFFYRISVEQGIKVKQSQPSILFDINEQLSQYMRYNLA
jgi:transcriptional regulator